MNDDKHPDPTRRSLLKAAPLGALAVAAAAHARAPEAQPQPTAAAEPRKAQGDQQTAHQPRYYRTAAYW